MLLTNIFCAKIHFFKQKKIKLEFLESRIPRLKFLGILNLSKNIKDKNERANDNIRLLKAKR